MAVTSVITPTIIEEIDSQIEHLEWRANKLKELREAVETMRSCVLPFDTKIILGAVEKSLEDGE